MYDWRKMSREQRIAVSTHRRLLGLPLHAPPHFPDGRKPYLISAACFEHQPIISTDERRKEFESNLLSLLAGDGDADIRAWVVLPDHHHVLLVANLEAVSLALRRLHSGSAIGWNREDQRQGRKVWHRFADRAIRDERHYWATVNYIHGNPVKHGWVGRADEWKPCSLRAYLERHGRERMVEIWREYPVLDYGRGWDD
jgi:putative transposase